MVRIPQKHIDWLVRISNSRKSDDIDVSSKTNALYSLVHEVIYRQRYADAHALIKERTDRSKLQFKRNYLHQEVLISTLILCFSDHYHHR